MSDSHTAAAGTADAAGFERRFGGLRRLYGPEGAQRVFDAHGVVVGIGGVGSWAAEAFARSGVGRITLIDMDHVGESNTNRQIHAVSADLGRSKVDAMRDRIGAIHPWCEVDAVDDFVTPENWSALAARLQSSGAKLMVVDGCDSMAAKVTMANWALQTGVEYLAAGAAGGKRRGDKVEIGDVAAVTHDPLLAQLRYRLRKHHGAPRRGDIGVTAVFSREAVAPAHEGCGVDGVGDGSLNCHGYGSAVSVTATFGLCAAGWLMDRVASGAKKSKKNERSSKTQKNAL